MEFLTKERVNKDNLERQIAIRMRMLKQTHIFDWNIVSNEIEFLRAKFDTHGWRD